MKKIEIQRNPALKAMELQRELKSVREQQKETRSLLDSVSGFIQQSGDFKTLCKSWVKAQHTQFSHTEALVVELMPQESDTEVIAWSSPDSSRNLKFDEYWHEQYPLLIKAKSGFFNSPGDNHLSKIISNLTGLPRLIWGVIKPHESRIYLLAAGYDSRTAELFSSLNEDHHHYFLMVARYIELLSNNTFLIDELQREKLSLDSLNKELQSANKKLEEEIQQRKEVQEQLTIHQNHLIEASRRAGMAEAATDVLHNVGNVLNSINVDAQLIRDILKGASIANLARTVDLISENKDNLGTFFTADQKGKLVPAYLEKIVKALQNEREDALDRDDRLLKNVELINTIVSLQQSNYIFGGVLEQCQLSEMVESAIQINLHSCERNNIVIEREYENLSTLLTNKYKVIQILINLISNAKNALSTQNDLNRKIKVIIKQRDEQYAEIIVVDNGPGIPKDTLKRIFNHGFTTRKGGHGFGLHSAANNANEIGGSLVAFSEGPGKGAEFRLEIPLNPG